MSAVVDHPPLPAAGRRAWPFASIIQRTFAMICTWRARIRQRNELLMLDAVELRDLSLNKADINLEARKPFWTSVQLRR